MTARAPAQWPPAAVRYPRVPWPRHAITLTLWQRLTRFLDYSVLEFSNNLAENAIRPVALGRKNWIHLGSQEAGPRIAAIVSVVQVAGD